MRKFFRVFRKGKNFLLFIMKKKRKIKSYGTRKNERFEEEKEEEENFLLSFKKKEISIGKKF